MPYKGEIASKTAHSEFIKNPDVIAFLNECVYLTPPSDEEVEAMAAKFTNQVSMTNFPALKLGISKSGLCSSALRNSTH